MSQPTPATPLTLGVAPLTPSGMRRSLARFVGLCVAAMLTVVLVGCAGSRVELDPREPFTLGGERMQIDFNADLALLKGTEPLRFGYRPSIKQVTIDGRTFLGRAGLVGEFGITGVGVLGYDRADVGDSFLKIGVGELRKITDQPYDFSKSYPLLDRADLSVRREGEHRVVVTTEDRLADNRYAYRLVETYDIDRALGTVVLTCVLTNLGAEPFEFEHYAHNFFAFNGHGLDPAYTLDTDFGFVPTIIDGNGNGNGDKGPGPNEVMHEVAVAFNMAPHRARTAKVWYLESDTIQSPAANVVRLTHADLPHVVEVRGDFPVSRFAIYADRHAVCPEVFHRDHLRPNQTATWALTYRFILPARLF